jgi:hypothetical protein
MRRWQASLSERCVYHRPACLQQHSEAWFTQELEVGCCG